VIVMHDMLILVLRSAMLLVGLLILLPAAMALGRRAGVDGARISPPGIQAGQGIEGKTLLLV
jgi:hypothetical protein